MSAELECAAWDIHGHKLWSTCVQPPWQYTVHGDIVHLVVMGNMSDSVLQSVSLNLVQQQDESEAFL